MEHGGGFHGYQRPPPQITPGSSMQAPESANKSATSDNECLVREQDNECLVREQDRLMPIANVSRIMRKILPPHAKISDDAKETIQECVSEYISFITGEANDRCQREQRKTITAEDILWAMNKLGFDDSIEPLTMYLHRYRELDGGERGCVRSELPPVASFKQSGIDVLHHMGHHLFGTATMAGLLKDPPIAGPSRHVSGFEPYAKCKE